MSAQDDTTKTRAFISIKLKNHTLHQFYSGYSPDELLKEAMKLGEGGFWAFRDTDENWHIFNTDMISDAVISLAGGNINE